MTQLTGKVALITGASGGLGNFVTEAFLGADATVIGVARSVQPSSSKRKFATLSADLSKGEETGQMVETVVQQFERIDILVHVMGAFAGGEFIDNTDDATWDLMMNVNVRSTFNVCRAVLPHMRKARQGRVIAIGARSALEPKAGLSAYCASKAALVSLIGTAALEGKGDGITANVILPGTMDTPANRSAFPSADFSKWVPPARVAGLALWLASDEASQVSGALIPVYGAGL